MQSIFAQSQKQKQQIGIKANIFVLDIEQAHHHAERTYKID